MALTLRWVTIDTPTAQQLAPFWEQLLGWRRDPQIDDEQDVALVPSDDAPGATGLRGLLLFHSDDPKRVKNRLHLDLVADGGGLDARDAEVERALSLGATRVDIGQEGTEHWVVLADPEGNEFCILTAPEG